MPFSKNITPLRLAGIYALFGAFSIVLSNKILHTYFSLSSPAYLAVQNIKGWLFVLVSAGLIYFVSKRDADARRRENARTVYQSGLIEDVSDALISSDMQLNVIIWNSAAEKIYQWKASEVIGQKLTDILKTEYANEGSSSEAYQELMDNGHWSGEVTQLRKDGTRFPVLTSVSFVTDEQGVRIGLLGINRDISERKLVEEALSNSEAKYRTLVENSLQGIIIYRGPRVVYVNPAMCAINGYSAEELFAMTPQQIVAITHPDDLVIAQERAQKRLAGDTSPSNHEIRIIKKDGSIAWLHSFNNNIIFEGQPALLSTVIDITERKQAEQALLQNEKRFRALIENGLDNISLLARDGTLLWESPATVRTLGYGENAFKGRNILELVHPDDTSWVGHQFADMVSHPGVAYRGTFRVQHANGGWRWIESIGTNLLDEPGVGAIVINYRDVTEKKIAEESLYYSQQQLLSMIRDAPLPIAMFDLAMRYVAVSERWVEEYGRGYTELIGKSHYEVNPDLPERWKEIHQRGLSGETLRNDDDLWVQADGTKKWLRWAIVPWHDGKGRIEGIILSAEDITIRRQAEVALSQSEQNYRNLLEHASDAIFIFNDQARYILVNEVACALMGYTKEELLSMHVSELVAPEDLQRMPLRMQELRNGDVLLIERTFMRKDGKRIQCEVSAKMLPDGRFQSLVRDITSRKRTALRDQKRAHALELLARGDSLPHVLEAILAIVETDLEDAICSILLLDESKKHLLLGAAPRLPDFYNEAIHGIAIGEGEGSCGTSAYTRQRVIVEDIETHPYWDKYRELAQRAGVRSCWSQPILSSEGEVLGTFAVYHTQPCTPGTEELDSILKVSSLASIAIERKRAEQTIRAYAEDLEQRVEQRTAELIEAIRTKDEFLANMSHELRTPLNSVLGFSESLLEGVRGPLDQRQQQAIELIHSSGEHLLGLINDILDVSKIESGKFELRAEAVSVNDICRSSLNFIKQLAGKKSISVEYVPLPDLTTTLWVDPKRLKQILVNLLNNAVKFTPEHGSVTLQVSADLQQTSMSFSITDSGIGIAAHDLQKLFKPFVQLDSSLSRQYEGSGLGLLMVQKLVEMHEGTVYVESEPGRGSHFIVSLPWIHKMNAKSGDEPLPLEVAPRRDPASNIVPVHGNGARILLAEDNEANVMVIKEYLENQGYEIFVASHGQEAITKAAEASPAIILMDIQMPHMDGLEATRRLRATPGFDTVPIIALTAFAMPGDRERCLEAGVSEYMTKPVHLRKLHEMISGFLTK
jgi:PAS domain S-box-containing protein